MPALPAWHSRVPEILATLRADNGSAVLDRAAFESLFGVSRRQAIRLMHGLGGYQTGRAFLVDRRSLIRFLETVADSGSVTRAIDRKQRILSALESTRRELRAREVLIPTSNSNSCASSSSLPQGVERISQDRIQIQFGSATELLSRIVDLVTAASDDFEAFRRQVE